MIKLIKIKSTEIAIKQAVKSGQTIYNIVNAPEYAQGLKTAVALGWLDNTLNK